MDNSRQISIKYFILEINFLKLANFENTFVKDYELEHLNYS